MVRRAHPYEDIDVIDSRAPRTNQAFIGSLSLVAFLFGFEWLPALLALQLFGGLTFGRRYCAPCLFYFEVLQPRFGEGRLEDARPPRFANMVGLAFLSSATLAFVLGASTVGWALTLAVAALALLAAATGFCAGCTVYVWIARLRGLRRLDAETVEPLLPRLEQPEHRVDSVERPAVDLAVRGDPDYVGMESGDERLGVAGRREPADQFDVLPRHAPTVRRPA